MSDNRMWMYARYNDRLAFEMGLETFLEYARNQTAYTDGEGNIRCPCKKCKNQAYLDVPTVRKHVGRCGFVLNYTNWVSHGEARLYMPTADGSGPLVSGTPETLEVGTTSRAKRPKGPTATQIRARSAIDGGRIWFERDATGKLMEPLGLSKACTASFKRFDNPGGYTWKKTHPDIKTAYFNELRKEFSWAPEDEKEVRDMWEKNARKRYFDMISEYKSDLMKSLDRGKEMSRPAWMSPEFWTGLQEYWQSPEAQALSARARANRMSEHDGQGTGVSRHVDGSQSTRILQQYMDAPNYATFLRLHMYADGSYTSERDARIDHEVHRLAAATGREHRLDEVYLEVVQSDRSRIYGVGSVGQSQASRGSTRSTGTSAVSQQLYETRISTLEERMQQQEEEWAVERAAIEARLAAEQAERQAFMERFAQMEQLMKLYGWSSHRAPSPTHRHHDDDAAA
ncbi:uncharacterized protein LOC130988082 [Salvia miltiorrhiza]|uniref:uncharacterized protein LOC130988082 n=1 Tax=Salvia miltiorrhiza TaxID=226208 RepID=UPI0025AB82F7|nr:uncharacterized protein LOC130988082 [Salvia miltiorrhiza]